MSSCIEWTGARHSSGYGVKRTPAGLRYVHRLAWEAAHGPIPEGMFVCHHCDNPPCYLVDHLFLGTCADNTQDMLAKGREQPWGRAATACVHGHPFDEANTHVSPRGWRVCRTCNRLRARRRRAGQP